MAKVYATRTQIVGVSDLLRAHLMPADGGLFVYAEGWSDTLIAERLATPANPINEGHVAGLRADLYGNLRKSPAPQPVADDARIAILEAALAQERARNDRTAARLEELATLHARLCKTLKLNHVVDVAHLAGSLPERPAGTTRMLDLPGGANGAHP